MKESDILLNLNELEFDTSEELTIEMITSRWKKLSKLYHPDTTNSDIFLKSNKQAKINMAKDFLLNNIDDINYYIRRVNHRQTEEDKARDEKIREAAEAKKRKMEEERNQAADELKKAEEILKKAEAERRRAEEERWKAEAERKAAQNTYNNTYNSYGTKSNNSSINSGNSYSNNTYNYSSKANNTKTNTAYTNTNYKDTQVNIKSSYAKPKKSGKALKVFLILVGVIVLISIIVSTCSNGSNVFNNYTSVSTVEELRNMESGKKYKLENDIDLTDIEFVPLEKFDGTLEGNNKKIVNFTLTSFSTKYVGLFSELGENAVISNLIIENLNFDTFNSADAIGGLAGKSLGTITNVTVKGNIKTPGVASVGGIVGLSDNKAKIKRSTFDGEVVGSTGVGGIVGSGAPVDIDNCTTKGKITGSSYVGGIYGGISSSNGKSFSITGCTNDAEVIATNDYCGGIFGGIYCGNNWGGPSGHFLGCVNNGEIKGLSYTGGIAGMVTIRTSTITFDSMVNNGMITGNSYTGGIVGMTENEFTISTATINASVTGVDYVGGVLGKGNDVTITGVSNDYEIKGSTFVGGIAGSVKKVASCKNRGNVTATGTASGSVPWTSLGGVAGACDLANNCSNSGTITCDVGNGVGGIAGANASLYISCEFINCENTGNITVKNGNSVAGIIGAISHSTYKELGLTVSGCTNSGTIKCTTGSNVGGIVGQFVGDSYNISGSVKVTISSSHSLGDILCPLVENVGGIIGSSKNGTMTIHTVTIKAKVYGYKYNGSIVGTCNNFGNISDYTNTFTIIKTGYESVNYKLGYIGTEAISPIVDEDK